VKYFRPYLYGRKFQIVTDHRPLTWLMSLKEGNSKLIRWRLKLQEYDYEIVYKKGKLNSNADALSRAIINDPHNNPIEINMKDVGPDNAGSIIHSAEENLNDGIPISERPINNFNLQIILEISTEPSTTLLKPFRTKQRKIIKRPSFTTEEVTDILKTHLAPNKLTAIYTHDDIFALVRSSYSQYFSNSRIFRIVRCTNILTDVTESDEQERIINKYHKESNHRGIDESHLHLKRQYYFPFMKNKITQTINNCEKCKTLKYDRNPPKLFFQKPKLQQKLWT